MGKGILTPAGPVEITCSFGISTLVADSDTAESLRKRADRALYRAKADGRDRVVTELRAQQETGAEDRVANTG